MLNGLSVTLGGETEGWLAMMLLTAVLVLVMVIMTTQVSNAEMMIRVVATFISC